MCLKNFISSLMYIAQLQMGLITLEQFRELTFLPFNEYIISKNHVSSRIFRSDITASKVSAFATPRVLFIALTKFYPKAMSLAGEA